MVKTSTPRRRGNTNEPRKDAPLIEVATIPVRGRHRRETPSERLEWDDAMPGLAVRIRETGARSWVVVRKTNGRTMRKTLGPVDALTAAQARALASVWVGGDAAAMEPPRVDAFGETFLADWAPRWKPMTRQSNADCVRGRIVPGLGAVRIDLVTPQDVTDWLADMRVSEATRNRALAILSGMMRHAEALGHRKAGSNPCKGMRRRKAQFKARYLTEAEYCRLGSALRDADIRDPITAAAIRFLALTGARRGEAEGLTWAMLFRDRAVLPDSKTGPRAIWLGKAARKVLAGVPRTSSPLVFPGAKGKRLGHRLSKAWAQVRQDARLKRLRLHDLRHGFASVAVTHGEPLRTVGGLLGHADQMTTEAYAHLAQQTIAAAAERVGQHLDRTLQPPKPSARGRGWRKVVEPEPLDDSGGLRFAREVAQFLRGSESLTEFCRLRGLPELAFRNAVMAWREAEAAARGQPRGRGARRRKTEGAPS